MVVLLITAVNVIKQITSEEVSRDVGYTSKKDVACKEEENDRICVIFFCHIFHAQIHNEFVTCAMCDE